MATSPTRELNDSTSFSSHDGSEPERWRSAKAVGRLLRERLIEPWGQLTHKEISGSLGDLGTFLPLTVCSFSLFLTRVELRHVRRARKRWQSHNAPSAKKHPFAPPPSIGQSSTNPAAPPHPLAFFIVFVEPFLRNCTPCTLTPPS